MFNFFDNKLQSNFKTVTTAYLQFAATGKAFSGRDSVLLDSIANLSLYAHGLPVQMARNILDLELYDSPGGGSRMAQPVKVYHTPDRLELVPNPAKQTVSIIIPPDEKIEQVLIFDNTGRMSAQQSREDLLDVSLLQNGTYQIHVKTEVKTRQGKLIILK